MYPKKEGKKDCYMAINKFRGLGVALITPFKEDGSIDYDALKQISEETGHIMTDSEIKFALKEAGDGKTIPIDAFIKFMKS